MGHYDGSWGGGEWIAMTLLMVVFWGVVVALVVWAVRSLRPSGRGDETPENILAGRFARGEIDDDEFRRRRDALIGAGAPGRGGGA